MFYSGSSEKMTLSTFMSCSWVGMWSHRTHEYAKAGGGIVTVTKGFKQCTGYKCVMIFFWGGGGGGGGAHKGQLVMLGQVGMATNLLSWA